MALAQVFCRSLLLLFVFSIPLGIFGGLVNGLAGVLVGIGITALLLGMASMLLERLFVHTFTIAANRADPGNSGLLLSLERVLKDRVSAPLPRLFIFPDPYPDALVLKALGQTGTLLISQGLLSLLNEEQLEILVVSCVNRLKMPGIRLRSLSTVLAIQLLSWLPDSWRQLAFIGKSYSNPRSEQLSPFSALCFLVLYPWIQFCFKIGKLPPVKNANTNHMTAFPQVVQATQILGVSRSLGNLSVFSK